MRGKPFQRGNDPRRHKFTREECQRGYWKAIESVATRYPDAVDAANRQMTVKFLPSVLKKRRQPNAQ